jgi:hypothetical protein
MHETSVAMAADTQSCLLRIIIVFGLSVCGPRLSLAYSRVRSVHTVTHRVRRDGRPTTQLLRAMGMRMRMHTHWERHAPNNAHMRNSSKHRDCSRAFELRYRASIDDGGKVNLGRLSGSCTW